MRKIYCPLLLLLALVILALPITSQAQISVGISVHIGPPALPVYTQPICPAPGYIWTPGYWSYGPAGYYWVPGTWVLAPVGLLWTPGYWGWGGSAFMWHAGYWEPHVGFYGGINYGFGYGGVGFVGGRWDHGSFSYNTAVMHVNTTVIHNTYLDRTVVVNNTTVNRVSYNGGSGGITAQPTPREQIAEHERHTPPVAAQVQHEHLASTNRAFLASENHGHPAVAATSRPGEITGHGAPPERGSTANPPTNKGGPSHSNQPPSNGNNREVHSNHADSSHKPASKPKSPPSKEHKEDR